MYVVVFHAYLVLWCTSLVVMGTSPVAVCMWECIFVGGECYMMGYA